jgi:hypothetical protein
MDHSELTLFILIAMLALTLAGALIARRRELALRPIAAYAMLPETAADAVESSNRIHFSMGTSAIGQTSTVSALAAAAVIYRLAERLAVSEQAPLLTVGDAMTLPLAQDTLRRAYAYRQRLERVRDATVAWFPQGDRSLAMAAGIASLAADHNVTSNILLGRFGTEIAIIGESAARYNQGLVAHSDLPEGQAVAFAQADQVLIGEELYAGPAYLNQHPLETGGLVAMDILRLGIIVGIIITAIQAAL